MKSTFTLEQLATFALNQLMAGTCLDEVYENLAIFERLDDQEESHFFGLVEEKAKAFGMVPEVIATQRIPVSLMGLMALVYFQAKEGV